MKKNLFYIWMITILVVGFVSCTDMNHLHQPYLDEGETIYAAKVDSVLIRPGNMRLALDVYTPSQRAERGIVCWNNNQDTLDFDIENKVPGEAQELIISGLEEGTHIFTFVLFDAYGHKSLPIEAVGTVYGEDYASALLNRVLDGMEITNEGVKLLWRSAGEGLDVLLTYINADGKEVKRSITPEENEILITDAVPGSEFTYVTFYKPEEDAIDTFTSKPKTGHFPYDTLDRVGWEAIACSDEKVEDGGGKASVLDGDLNTYWHSQWGPEMPLPHWILIDMKKTYEIGGVEIVRRLNNTDTKTLKFEISEDGVTFIGVGDMDFGDSSNSAESKIITFPAVNGRYLKCWVTGSNSEPHASIAEIYVKGCELK